MANYDYTEDFTNFELVEHLYLARDAAATDLTVFMTALFAFLVTAYFAGNSLSRMQIGMAVFIYSLFEGITLFSLSTQLETTGVLVSKLAIVPGGDETTRYAFLTLLTVSWVVSIAFLIEIRLKGVKEEFT